MPPPDPHALKVNGTVVSLKVGPGLRHAQSNLEKGDLIELHLPMPVRRVLASADVKPDIEWVALQRGPIVFCAEWPDNPNGKVRSLLLPDSQPLSASYEPSLLNGVDISGRAFNVSKDANGSLTRTEQDFKAIPYYAWANRGKGEMAVWIADSESSVKISN